jgi:hypothetical protein
MKIFSDTTIYYTPSFNLVVFGILNHYSTIKVHLSLLRSLRYYLDSPTSNWPKEQQDEAVDTWICGQEH